MKKIIINIFMALTLMLMGFLMVFKYKQAMGIGESGVDANKANNADILMDINALKNEKAQLEKSNDEVLSKIKNYENIAANSNGSAEGAKSELDESRTLLGMTKVKGPGIMLVLKPKNDIFSTDFGPIDEQEITFLINELYSGSAEAVCINDVRITSQSYIKTSGNTEVKINNNTIDVTKPVLIKAIGDKKRLQDYLSLSHVQSFGNLAKYDIDISEENELTIPAYNGVYNYDNITKSKN